MELTKSGLAYKLAIAPDRIEIRSSMNKQTDFVDLNFTGAFQGANEIY